MTQSLAYINNEIVKLEEAKIEALDRGFVFGDGLYEIVAVFVGKFYQLDEHLQRYWNGAQEIMIENAPQPQELKEKAKELLHKSNMKKGIIYFQVTRGAAPRAHHFPTAPRPTVFMFAKEASFPDSEKRNKGVKTIIVPDERWKRCHIKSINLLPNCFYKEKARRARAFEAIQEHDLGFTEGTSTNLLAVKDGVIITAPAGPHILNGITRRTVLALAEEMGVKIEEIFLTREELLNCDEVFITSTINQILPINQIDNTTYPVNRFDLTFVLQKALEKHIKEYDF